MFLYWTVTVFSFCFISITDAIGIGTVRFYRNGIADTSQSWSSGIVQIYYASQWGNICDDTSFGSDEADVICHQLGYTGASSYSNTGSTTTWGTDSSGTRLDDVSCSSSSYLTITQCSFSTFISSSCTDNTDVVVSCYSTRIWDSPSSGDIRLTGGTYSSQGLLEVYCNGQWGTVCDDSFFSTEAIIACRQLGYNYYFNYNHLSHQINASQSIWLDTVDSCSSSTDTCLSSCGSCPATAITTCSHNEDVTLECRYSTSYSKVTDTTNTTSCYDREPAPVGTIRLFRNDAADITQSWSSGIVQIYYSSDWGNICDDSSFGSDEADVVCHQLGYSGASSYSNTGSTTIWGTDDSSTAMDEVSCSTSAYLTITQCSFSTFIPSSCTDATDAIVTCYSTRIWNSPVIGDIRLTGGKYSNEGLLEVYCNGQWGTVCDDSFISTEARIACRQLGYNDYDTYDQLTQRGNSSQNIWLNTQTSCSSTSDTCLTSCGSCPSTAITSCSHSEDITLACEYTSTNSKVNTVTATGGCYSDNSGTASTGTVRLFRNGIADTSQSWSSGIVQIYYSSSWGNICDDFSFAYDEADVICRQLGYTGASSYSNTGTTTTWGTDYSTTAMDDVSCSSSSYLTLTQCSFSTIIGSSCGNTNDVIVTCYSTRIWDSPSSGDIRLTGGTYSSQGLLEVYCNGQWGTVCDDSFLSTEARIACRQLGYNYYDTYDQLSLRGTSSQSIWLRYLSGCSSLSDSCLTNCGGCPSSAVSGCSHSEDITLVCEYSSSYSKVYSDSSLNCDISASSATTSLVGAIVGSVIGLTVCILVMTFVPICLCTCLGVGVRSAARSGVRTQVVAPPTTTTTTTTTTKAGNSTGTIPPPPAAYYPANPENQKPPSTQQNTTTAGYPTQQPPPGYSTLPNPAYSTPTGYPTQQPSAGSYPTQQQQSPPSYGDYPQYPTTSAPYGAGGGAAYPQQPPAPYGGGEYPQQPPAPYGGGEYPQQPPAPYPQ